MSWRGRDSREMTGANTTPLSFDRRQHGGGGNRGGGGGGSLLNPAYLSGNTDGENGNYGGQPFEDPRPLPRMMDDYDRPPPGRGDHRGGGGGRGRGRGGGGGRGGGFTPSEGDWPCPDPSCGNVNFARRTSCNRCGVDKPIDRSRPKGAIKIGSSAAEKSKGLFSADDWQCGKCGNVNWARRSTCNVCNGPQFTVEEERTGLGGGFDERGTVEYKEREESDDEFDDLGRKKRKKLPYKKPMIAQSVPDPPSEPEEEEEDEEEEDDDDGDLSKYDLWGDPEEDKKKEEVKPTNGSTLKPINEKKASVLLDEKKKSRSRSRSKRRSRSRSKDSSKKRSRRSRSSSSSSSSSSSRSRSRSRRKRRKSGKRRSRSSSSSSSSRSRSRSRKSKSKKKSKKRSKKRSRSRSRTGRKRGRSSSSSRSRSRSRRRSRFFE